MKNLFMVIMAMVIACVISGCDNGNKTVKPVVDDEVTDESSDVVDENSDEAVDENSDEAADEVTDDVYDEVVDEVVDEVADEVEDDSVDEESDEDSVRVRNVIVSGNVSSAPHPESIYTLALKNGVLYTWNAFALTAQVLDLEGVDEKDILDIDAGTKYACALLKNGAVYCWYSSKAAAVVTPMKVLDQSEYVKIESGEGWQCGITSGNRMDCWGVNSNGVIDPEQSWTNIITEPVVKSEDVVDVEIDAWYITTLVTSGDFYIWIGQEFKIFDTGEDRAVKMMYSDGNIGYLSEAGVMMTVTNVASTPYLSEHVCVTSGVELDPEAYGRGTADVAGNIYYCNWIEDSQEYEFIKQFDSKGRVSEFGDTAACWSTVDEKIWCLGDYPGDGSKKSELPVEVPIP